MNAVFPETQSRLQLPDVFGRFNAALRDIGGHGGETQTKPIVAREILQWRA